MNFDFSLLNNSKKSEFRVIINDELVLRETNNIGLTRTDDIMLLEGMNHVKFVFEQRSPLDLAEIYELYFFEVLKGAADFCLACPVGTMSTEGLSSC